MDLQEVAWRGMDRVDLVLDRDSWQALANTEMNLWVL
jgi:hypothetical protein